MSELIHTCYRVLDLERSAAFYEKLGFEEMRRMPIGDEATNVFMGLPGDGARLELTLNHGRTEPYEIGTGYGHIAITADDLDATLERLAARRDRAREAALHGPRGRLADLLRPRPRRLPDRADREGLATGRPAASRSPAARTRAPRRRRYDDSFRASRPEPEFREPCGPAPRAR